MVPTLNLRSLIVIMAVNYGLTVGCLACHRPSPEYNFEAFETALALPSVAGVTAYANLVSGYKKRGQYKECPFVKKGAVPPSIDKGCLVAQIFEQYSFVNTATAVADQF